MKYYVLAAQDSTLEYVWSSLTGGGSGSCRSIPTRDTFRKLTPRQPPRHFERPEGTWFFYVTSSITGRHILARSGSVIVRHWPYVKTVGLGLRRKRHLNAATRQSRSTLDSGLYYGYDNNAGGATPRKDLVFTRVSTI